MTSPHHLVRLELISLYIYIHYMGRHRCRVVTSKHQPCGKIIGQLQRI